MIYLLASLLQNYIVNLSEYNFPKFRFQVILRIIKLHICIIKSEISDLISNNHLTFHYILYILVIIPYRMFIDYVM